MIPFSLVDRMDGDDVLVVAVAHPRRSPTHGPDRV
jgi:hypothetical protein